MALVEHRAHLHGVLRDDAVVLIHVLLEIEIAKLEHERKLLLRVDNIKEAACGKAGEQDEITNENDRATLPHDVRVLELFQKTDLSDGGARHTLIFGIEPNPLEGHDLACFSVLRLVHDTVGALSQLVDLHVFLHVCFCR